jgi:predicted transcriptional regulator
MLPSYHVCIYSKDMASTKNRTLRLDGSRLSALEAIARATGTNVSAVVRRAIHARLAAAEAGTLPPAGNPERTTASWRIDSDTWDALLRLAQDRNSDRSKEVFAAIDDQIARFQRGELPGAPAPDGTRKPRVKASASAERTAKPAVPVTFKAPAPASDAICPPHPKARVHKGLCGACGRQVGTETVA